MASSGDSLIKVGACTNPAQVALVRAEAERRGVRVFMKNEHTAAMVGPAVGLPSVDVLVPPHDEAEGRALVLSVIESGAEEAVDNMSGSESESERRVATDELASVRRTLDLRRRTIAVVFVGIFLPFGAAHATAGLWWRAVLIAVSIVGATQLKRLQGAIEIDVGMWWASLVLLDVAGALRHLYAGRRPAPTAVFT